MTDKSVMERIQDFMMTFPGIDPDIPVEIDAISDKPKSYSIMSAPSSPPTPDVLGNLRYVIVFEFGIRELISDRKVRQENVRFLENLNSWIWEQNQNKNFPEMYDDEIPLGLEVSDSGYLIDTDESRQTGIYVSQLTFTYKKRRNIYA